MTLRILTAMLLLSLAARGQLPMKSDYENSAEKRWLDKKVTDSRILDKMDSLHDWIPFTHGAISVVDARETAKIKEADKMVADLGITSSKSHEGNTSLRLKLPTRLDGPGPANGRGWGTAGVVRQFDNEDWRKFNRISLWIYPDNPGAYQIWLELRFFNDGKEKLPALFGQEGENTILLRNHEWNHILWEIGNVARDRITGFEISSWMPGNEPEACDSLTFYFDDLVLEKVEPDYIEGWGVWPGRISFCHTGYQTGSPKSVIATGMKGEVFSLIDQSTGKTIVSKTAETIDTHLGSYQVFDFSGVEKPGTYIIKAGETETRPFRIDDSVWDQTILKALNFFYSERCGAAIPGVHGICHRDWTCVHGDKSIVINGGWHDAGDLTQGMTNTGEAVFAMFSLAEKIRERGDNPGLYERVIDEAKWGLDWILKTSFGDGYRNEGSINSRRTNGIIGDDDDVRSTSRNSPKTNFVACAAEAIAGRILSESDPRLAAYCIRMARADWKYAVAGMESLDLSSRGMWTGTFDSGSILHEIPSAGILASVELWLATGDNIYREKAASLAKVIIESQQRKRTDWDIPFSGFFYTGPDREHILHYCHNGREQAPVVALTLMCEAFPDDPDWMKWYSSVALHSEYLKKSSSYTAPYNFIPASIYTDTEYLQQVPESRKESFRKQVLNGIPLGKGHYLRMFPVWMDYRGHFGTILPQAQALVNAARLRGDKESADLAMYQLEWITGRNPFSQSTMYGEGYDYTPLYTPSSGNIVGALPVGIQTRGDNDVPYWPVQSTWTYKEVWVHPVSEWLWLMSGLEGPAIISGRADNRIGFTNNSTGKVTTASPDKEGKFRLTLPAGSYTVDNGSISQTVTYLPSEVYNTDLRQDNEMAFDVTCEEKDGKAEVTVRLTAEGSGEHSLELRSANLMVRESSRKITLKPGKKLTVSFKCRVVSADEPWFVVVVPDGNIGNRREIKCRE
jgi:hypothetical protein